MPIISKPSERDFDYFTTQKCKDTQREVLLLWVAQFICEERENQIAQSIELFKEDEKHIHTSIMENFPWQSLKDLIVCVLRAKKDAAGYMIFNKEDYDRFDPFFEHIRAFDPEQDNVLIEQARDLGEPSPELAPRRMTVTVIRNRANELLSSSWVEDVGRNASYKKATGEALFKLKVHIPLVSHLPAPENKEEESSPPRAHFFSARPSLILNKEALEAGKEICDLVKAAIDEGTILHAKAIHNLDCKEIDLNSFFVRNRPRFHTESQVVMYLPTYPNKEKLAQLVRDINHIAQKYGFPDTTPASDARIFGIVSLRKDYNDAGQYITSLEAKEMLEHLREQEAIVADLFGGPSLQAAAAARQ